MRPAEAPPVYRKNEKALQEEGGGAGVYSADLRKHYLLDRGPIQGSSLDGQIYSLIVDMERIERNEVRSAILSDLCTYAVKKIGKETCAEYLNKLH